MGKAQVTSPTAESSGSSILKIKNCNNCGAEYARKGTLCGSCRGIRHRLLKKERERKSSSTPSVSPPAVSIRHSTGGLSSLVAASPSVSPIPVLTTPLPTPPPSHNHHNHLHEDTTYVELPPIHIPIPARIKESPQHDRLVASITSCGRCDSNLDCQRCFLMDRELRRLNQERLDLQKQLSEMEIEVHAMRLQLMNEMRFNVTGFTGGPGVRQQTPSPTQTPVQFCFSPQGVPSAYQEPTPIHGVSVCQLVN